MIMFRSGGSQVGSEIVAKLSRVKNLDFLWQEYVSGINGFKPAPSLQKQNGAKQ